MRFLLVSLLFLSLSRFASADIVVGFEELTAFTGNSTAGGGQFYNGNNGSNTANTNGWSSQGVFFGNKYSDPVFPGDYWSGWSYSNVKNTTTTGFTNQYAAFAPASPGAGVGGSNNYALAYSGSNAFFNLPSNTLLSSVQLTNTTYAALSMQNGDQFAKEFGGPTGNDPDFFRVSFDGFDGLNGTGNSVGSVLVDLSDFTFANNSQDYILSDWLNVNLSSIATAKSVSLSFTSSDVGAFGINTPTYVAIDNLTLTAVPEPSSLALLGIVGSCAACWRQRRNSTRSNSETER